MGQGKSVIFSDKELEDYQDLTYLTKMEILKAYDRFNALMPADEKNMKKPVLPVETIMNIPELRANPFKDRICKIFSTEPGRMSFDDFLDMISVFSERASKSVKTEYAFRIFDFDGDDYLSKEDLKNVILRLIGNNTLNNIDLKEILDNVMVEADLDGDDILNYAEFEHVIAKLPDFESNFRIRL